MDTIRMIAEKLKTNKESNYKSWSEEDVCYDSAENAWPMTYDWSSF
jgi:hypothetical protein